MTENAVRVEKVLVNSSKTKLMKVGKELRHCQCSTLPGTEYVVSVMRRLVTSDGSCTEEVRRIALGKRAFSCGERLKVF